MSTVTSYQLGTMTNRAAADSAALRRRARRDALLWLGGMLVAVPLLAVVMDLLI